MEIIDYLLARKKAGGGSDVTIEQLTATENGTYSKEGIAYSPVVVNVPAPANSYQLKDLPSGTVSTIDDGTDLPMPSLKVDIEPVQSGSGDPSPDNIRPISGWTAANVNVSPTTSAEDGTTYTIEFRDGDNPLTVYGGTLDVTSGELVVDKYLYSFTGNESFLNNQSAWGDYSFLYNTEINLKSSFSTLAYCKSSHLNLVNGGAWNLLTPYAYMIASNMYIGIGYDGTETELKSWLAAQNATGTPVQILGMLAEPITYHLTPTQVRTLVGNNNIWADTGDIISGKYFKSLV